VAESGESSAGTSPDQRDKQSLLPMGRAGQKDSGAAQQVEPQSSLGGMKRAYLPSNCAYSQARIAVEDHVECVKGVRIVTVIRRVPALQNVIPGMLRGAH
jgi:hypothetical protein